MRFLQKHLLASWQGLSCFEGKYLVSRVVSLLPSDPWPNWEKQSWSPGHFWSNGRKIHLIPIFAFLTNPQCCHYTYRQRNALSKELVRANSPTNHLWDLGDRNTLERMKEKKHRPPKQKPTTLAQSNLSSICPTKIHKPRLFHNKHVTLWEPLSDSEQSPLVTNTHNTHTATHWAST